jgi:hypothetical protein
MHMTNEIIAVGVVAALLAVAAAVASAVILQFALLVA